jgi:hypothetical protein
MRAKAKETTCSPAGMGRREVSGDTHGGGGRRPATRKAPSMSVME